MRGDIDRVPTRCAAWFLAGILAACGGGGSDGMAPSAAGSATSPVVVAATPPAEIVLADTARTIDGPASANATALRVARSANGDGFAVWLADDGTRRNVWANRYGAEAAAWAGPVKLETAGTDIDDLDVAVDANGNATVVWHDGSAVMAARFDSGLAGWTPPQMLTADGRQPRVASNAGGTVLAVYVGVSGHLIRGRFFDRTLGTWEPEAAIEQNNTGTGFSSNPSAALDADGNALAAFNNARTGAGIVASNHFSRSRGGWAQLGPSEFGILGAVDGSFSTGPIGAVQLTGAADGNFQMAWQAAPSFDAATRADVLVATFTSSTRTWSAPRILVAGRPDLEVQFQRIASDSAGNAVVLWTERDPMRTRLMAVRLDHAGTSCSGPEVIDSAVGAGAARADLSFDARGRAMAIWQSFEGGRADDGSRSNIGINRFDGHAWTRAVFAETDAGNATEPRVSAASAQALLGWIQLDGGIPHVRVLLQPLVETTGP